MSDEILRANIEQTVKDMKFTGTERVTPKFDDRLLTVPFVCGKPTHVCKNCGVDEVPGYEVRTIEGKK